jgi:hypothetical protein
VLNLWGKKTHVCHLRDADSHNSRNDVLPGHMAAQVQEVVALLKDCLTPLPSEIELR